VADLNAIGVDHRGLSPEADDAAIAIIDHDFVPGANEPGKGVRARDREKAIRAGLFAADRGERGGG
jgi:hypothetical protein